MEEKQLLSPGGPVYYWVEKCSRKGAQNLVFLPGLTANHHLFDLQYCHFSGIHTLLGWDAPAHGKSRPYNGFSYAQLAKELLTILDAEGLEKVVLIGQSAGGFVAQSFLARHGERVVGLLTIGSCPYGPEYYSSFDLFWLQQTEWTTRLFPNRMLRSLMAKMCGATPFAQKNMLDMLEDYTKKELCHLMFLGFSKLLPELQHLTISCPVWLTLGELDKLGKVKKYNEQWHQREGYPLYILQGASHNANVDKPKELNRILENFLATLRPSATEGQ